MTPRAGRLSSGTRGGFLGGHAVEISAESCEVDARRVAEHCDCGVSAHESVSAQRGELSDGRPVPRHYEGLTLVQLAHDLAALVAQLPLGDLSSHLANVARRATAEVPDPEHKTERGRMACCPVSKNGDTDDLSPFVQ